MPQLTVRGINPPTMQTLSQLLMEELAAVCGCGADNFTIDCLHVTSVFGGQSIETFPFIEVSWFDRGPDVRTRFAQTLTRHIQQAGIADVEIAFKVYREDSYFVNGESCG